MNAINTATANHNVKQSEQTKQSKRTAKRSIQKPLLPSQWSVVEWEAFMLKREPTAHETLVALLKKNADGIRKAGKSFGEAYDAFVKMVSKDVAKTTFHDAWKDAGLADKAKSVEQPKAAPVVAKTASPEPAKPFASGAPAAMPIMPAEQTKPVAPVEQKPVMNTGLFGNKH